MLNSARVAAAAVALASLPVQARTGKEVQYWADSQIAARAGANDHGATQQLAARAGNNDKAATHQLAARAGLNDRAA